MVVRFNTSSSAPNTMTVKPTIYRRLKVMASASFTTSVPLIQDGVETARLFRREHGPHQLLQAPG
jgi:hypothetical protein